MNSYEHTSIKMICVFHLRLFHMSLYSRCLWYKTYIYKSKLLQKTKIFTYNIQWRQAEICYDKRVKWRCQVTAEKNMHLNRCKIYRESLWNITPILFRSFLTSGWSESDQSNTCDIYTLTSYTIYYT